MTKEQKWVEHLKSENKDIDEKWKFCPECGRSRTLIQAQRTNMRYFYSIVEYGIMNPEYFKYRSGRVEVFDRKAHSAYQIYEANFLIPEEFIENFRAAFDWVYSDKPLRINWDMKDRWGTKVEN